VTSGVLVDNESCDDCCQGDQGIGKDHINIEWLVERTLVKIGSVGLLELPFSRMEGEGRWDDKKYEGPANTSSVGYENLGLLEEDDYDYHRDRYYDTPDTLNKLPVIL
jgi:hypothetical protein